MRQNKRKVLPNSKELVVNYNDRIDPEQISEHNDVQQIEWTEIPKNAKQAPNFITGEAAQRIPDKSTPRYKLFWPLRYGWFNEEDYDNKFRLFEDITTIIEYYCRIFVIAFSLFLLFGNYGLVRVESPETTPDDGIYKSGLDYLRPDEWPLAPDIRHNLIK